MFGENPEFLTQKVHSFSLYRLPTEEKKPYLLVQMNT